MISTQDVAATIGAYTQSARFRASHCTQLALQLARMAPTNLTDDQRTALETVQARATEVEGRDAPWMRLFRNARVFVG